MKLKFTLTALAIVLSVQSIAQLNWYQNGTVVSNQILQELIVPTAGHESIYFELKNESTDTVYYISDSKAIQWVPEWTQSLHDCILSYLPEMSNPALNQFLAPGESCYYTLNTNAVIEGCAEWTIDIKDTLGQEILPLMHVRTQTSGASCSFLSQSEQVLDISIYPNPASDVLVIDSAPSENSRMKIVDINGKEVLTPKLEGASTQIDVSKLDKGVYFVIIENNNEIIKQEKLILK